MHSLTHLYLDHNELITLGNCFGPVGNNLNIQTLDISYNLINEETSLSTCLIISKLTRVLF